MSLLPLIDAARARRFDLIAFDWDGTLFDSTAIITRCIQCAVQDVGGTVPSDRDASYVIGMGLMQALAHAAPDVPVERYPELGARYQHHYKIHQTDISLFNGVLEMLLDLKTRHPHLTVATGKSRRGLDEALQTVRVKRRVQRIPHGRRDGGKARSSNAERVDARIWRLARSDVNDWRHHTRPADGDECGMCPVGCELWRS